MIRIVLIVVTSVFAPVDLGIACARASGPSDIQAMRRSLPWQIALTPHSGAEPSDQQITQAQQEAENASDPRPPLERLGWLFVAKARVSHDAGFYKLAEQCALALQVADEKNPAALLLLGHVAQSLHHFKEAEAIGRQIVAQREFAYDHGLLGDALLDQGKLAEAREEYQRMVDLRPGLQSYGRVAQVRWLKGDLAGAIEAAELSIRAGSPQDAEAMAWALSRLASLQAQAGAAAKAEAACEAATRSIPDYPPALLLRGRILLAAGKATEAAVVLGRAVKQSPQPEYQWAFADALRTAKRPTEAAVVEAELDRTGAANDSRTFALYLATRGDQVDVALRLAERELKQRADVFSHDALAWAQTAAGRHAEAWKSMERALAEGTKDARLFLHAAVISARIGHPDAAEWRMRALALDGLLLPSEHAHLAAILSEASQAVSSEGATPAHFAR